MNQRNSVPIASFRTICLGLTKNTLLQYIGCYFKHKEKVKYLIKDFHYIRSKILEEVFCLRGIFMNPLAESPITQCARKDWKN